jgi:hypothetical protein
MVSRGVFESFMFLYPGLLYPLLLLLLLLFWMGYSIGVCLAGKPLPLVSQEDCCVAFLFLQSFDI